MADITPAERRHYSATQRIGFRSFFAIISGFLIGVRVLLALLFICLAVACDTETELQFDYNAFPDILRTKDGKIICVFYNGWEHASYPDKKNKLRRHGGRILAAYSVSDGMTWSSPNMIIDTPFDDRDPSLFMKSSGELMCSYFSLRTGGHDFDGNTLISRSLDNGHQWDEPTLVAARAATSSPIVETKNGSLILPIYTMEKGVSSCHIKRSVDNGTTWLPSIRILRHSWKSFSEPAIVKIKDRLIAICRIENVGQHMYFSESVDDGKTWPIENDAGFPGEAPYMFNYNDSVVLLAHRHPVTSLRVSSCNDIKWSDPVAIDHEPQASGAYPSIVHIKGGMFLIAYYFEIAPMEQAEIRFRYFWLKNGVIEVGDVISTINVNELLVL